MPWTYHHLSKSDETKYTKVVNSNEIHLSDTLVDAKISKFSEMGKILSIKVV